MCVCVCLSLLHDYCEVRQINVSSAHSHAHLIVCLCVSVGCTDADLRSLASRLKDWFGVLHTDANRDLKSSTSDAAQGRKCFTVVQMCSELSHNRFINAFLSTVSYLLLFYLFILLERPNISPDVLLPISVKVCRVCGYSVVSEIN